MTDNNRGAYTPQSEAPLAFDARHSRGPGGGGRGPSPVTLIVSAIILGVLVIAVVVLILKGTRENAPDTGTPIETMKTVNVPEAKAMPEPAGRLQITDYKAGDPLPETAPTFTKGPETPAAKVPPAPAPPSTQPAATTTAPAKTTPAPGATPAVKAAPAPAAKAESSGGGARVQIGAFSTRAQAEQSWTGVASKVPGRIAGKVLSVEQAEVNGQTFNRALVSGFANRAEAESFCAALKAQGGDCSVRN